MEQNPFNSDISNYSSYQYTLSNKISAKMANQRFTDEIIASADFHDKSVVDIGCGDGTYTVQLLARGGAKSVLGIDPAAKAVETAISRYCSVASDRIHFRAASAEELVNLGMSFELAILRGVLHHTSDPQHEIAQALKLAPAVIILEPNGSNPVLKIIEKVSSYHRAHQERSFLLSTYRAWIAAQGGKIVRAKYFGLVPMFCPELIASIGRRMEPFIEKLPFVRRLLCGQILIHASRL